MKQILKIKQHKMHLAVAELSRCEKALINEQKRLQAAQQSIEKHMLWQREESDRLFNVLKKKPVTMIQLENYNAEIAKLRHYLNDLIQEKTKIEQGISDAEHQLDKAKISLKVVHQKHEKFHYCNQLNIETKKEIFERQDDNLLEEIVDATHITVSNKMQDFGDF
jgi:septal ring factor EnvC (AmiA/AmiB activator)